MSERLAKINSVLHQDIAKYAEKQNDSSEHIISIAYAIATPDLRKIRVGVSSFPENNKAIRATIENLTKSKSTLQLELARHHMLKNIPNITFEKSKGSSVSDKIDELFHNISNE